jgi:phage-related protein
MEEKIVFKLILTIEADNFLKSLPEKVSDKISSNIRRVQKGERNIELFKKLEGTEIWEFRTLFCKNAYRLFSFWDTENETLVIATHGIIKKTQKTPQKEITKAEQIRKMYFELKKKKK